MQLLSISAGNGNDTLQMYKHKNKWKFWSLSLYRHELHLASNLTLSLMFSRFFKKLIHATTSNLYFTEKLKLLSRYNPQVYPGWLPLWFPVSKQGNFDRWNSRVSYWYEPAQIQEVFDSTYSLIQCISKFRSHEKCLQKAVQVASHCLIYQPHIT